MAAENRVDVLVVDLTDRGLRARRTGAGAEGRIDAPGLRGAAGLTVDDLLAAMSPLLSPRFGAPEAIVWSVADLPRGLDARDLLAQARSVLSAPYQVVVDGAVATLAGALDAVVAGVVLDMGIGVHALATDFDQVWRRIDGWGPLLGGRGSAAWLGSQGLAAGLRHCDGVPGGSAALLDAGRLVFGDERGWCELALAPSPESAFADFAPVVGEVARRDGVAAGICRLAGEHLADTICAASQVLVGAPITATGGLLLIDAVKVSFASALGRRCRFLVPALGDSLAGAHRIAEHLAAGGRLPHHPPYVIAEGQCALPSA
ncbi:MAG: hypothetical protein Q4P32_08290 [Micrococcales bacterium]|nr:hypothetical protein [Micrococcales bacterium]